MRMTSTLLASAVMLALAGPAQAVHVDPNGRGQVLIYPYYTVNQHQQTLLSVTNTTAAGQAVKLRFHEGYNGREVLDFNVWLAPYDMWTGTVFALEDGAIAGEGAAILTADSSCTSPQFVESGLTVNGRPYLPFGNGAFVGVAADGGPTATSRTREGWVEIIAMTDVSEPLLTAISHSGPDGAAADCFAVRPDGIMGTPAVSNRPSGGLIGAASIVNVGQGTLLATRAEGLGSFTAVSLFTGVNSVLPNLASVNDVFLGSAATADLFDGQGRAQRLGFGGPGVSISRPVDAVSAVLMADQVYNEYVISPQLNAGSDWVMTFPTKRFYADSLYAGSTARPPFDELFSQNTPGQSRSSFARTLHNRESLSDTVPAATGPLIHWSTNVLPFGTSALVESAVLGSRLMVSMPQPTQPQAFESGWMQVSLDTVPGDDHALPASAEGKVLRGLPLIGFWATNLVNNAVSAGVLSNYSAAVRHATSVTCLKASDSTACD